MRRVSAAHGASGAATTLAAALAASATLGAPAPGTPSEAAGPAAGRSPLALEIVWVDLANVDARILAETRGVAKDLAASAGLRLTSRVELPGRGFAPGHAVVNLMGRSPNPRHADQPVAGAVGGGAGRLPAVWVFPRVVAQGLGLDMARAAGWSSGQRLDFARTLAAVVLHELAHLLGNAGHTPGGLMARTFDCSHRSCRDLALDETLASAFREALRPSASPRP